MARPEFDERFRTRYIWERDTIINRERQFYVDPDDPEHGYDPFSLDINDGLTITARKRALVNEDFTPQEYLSGVISTHKRQGIIEPTSAGPRRISAFLAMPPGAGVWPAWWFNPENESWPLDEDGNAISPLAELDGMEYVGQDGVYKSTIHTRNGGDVLNSDSYTHNCPDLSLTNFHWYHVERDENFIKFGFNDMWTKAILTPPDLQGPLHMNINLAIGGAWPESVSGVPTAQQYKFKIREVVVSKPDNDDITYPIDNPNRDVIARIRRLRDESIACINEAAERQFIDLS